MFSIHAAHDLHRQRRVFYVFWEEKKEKKAKVQTFHNDDNHILLFGKFLTR